MSDPAPAIGLPDRGCWSRADVPFALAAGLIVLLSIVRLVPTYGELSQTFDEPYHLLSGLQWHETGVRTGVEQPPLGQALIALGPRLAGLRCPPPGGDTSFFSILEGGNAILMSDGEYWRNLTLARLGTLPFLVLGCAVVFLWGRRWFSPATGLLAVLLFANVPPVLGHAGLATVDVACTATVALALYHLVRWLEEPSWRQTGWLGAAFAAAFLTKFSSLPFLAVCALAPLLGRVLIRRADWLRDAQLPLRARQAGAAAGLTLLLVWIGYGFDPFVELARGINEVREHNSRGHPSYLLGEFSTTGWWYYFPVALAVRTPLGLLLLCGAGAALVCATRTAPWQQRLTATFPLAILLFCMTSRLNLGLRHVLPVYPFLALLGAHAVVVALSRRRLLVVASALVTASVLVESCRAHPDYLTYFNPLALGRPERILCESDLDWGQDLHRLSRRLRQLGVRRLTIRYNGSAPMDAVDLPPFRILGPDAPATGWVAVSARYLFLENARDGSYGWLRRREPLEKVGQSIYLYRIDD